MKILLYKIADIKKFKKKVFGVIGFPIKHSMSPEIHKPLFKINNVKRDYVIVEIEPQSIKEAILILKEHFEGFNCTIPFKEIIIPFIDVLDKKAEFYGAVNTVKVICGKLYGYNTDGDGFNYAIKKANIDLENKKVLIIGAGGVSRVMAFEAALKNANISIFDIDLAKAQNLCTGIKEKIKGTKITALNEQNDDRYDIILNGSPVGMWDKISRMPIKLEIIKNTKAVFDTIYNPNITKLLLSAKENGCIIQGGMPMLVGQAVSAQKIWFDKEFCEKDIDKIIINTSKMLKQKFKYNIILSGFMGSGKTTVGKNIQEILNREFIDLDRYIEKKGKSITEIFSSFGEKGFRKIESECLNEVLLSNGAVISLGGGTLTIDENVEIIKNSASYIVFLNVSNDIIIKRVGNGEGRPLLSKEDLEYKANELYNQRMPIYINTADLIVDGDGDATEIAYNIANILGLLE